MKREGMKVSYNKITERDIYEVLVEADVCVKPYGYVTPVRLIAQRLKTSRYQVQKHLKELVKRGVAIADYECIYSEDETIPPCRGFALTDKGRETEYYKERQRQEHEYINELINGK